MFQLFDRMNIINKKTSITKITRPKISGVVLRERLFSLLDSGRNKPVMWITGPAGAGKTTLVASYLEARKLPCLWYQVDEGDGDIASFFFYMGLAAKKAATRHKKPMPLLTSEYLQGVPAFTRRYFEELFSRLKSPFTMVFDNFQDASSESFYDTVGLALDTIPEGIAIIILSRGELPAQFARLRANNKINFIGWNELSFTLQECRAFLKPKDGKSLPEETIRQLHDRTEGWAAGLVLMNEMAKTKEIQYSLLSELSNDAVFNYFASVIFDKTDSKTRDFLLKTSFFPSMSAVAAGQLTGNPDAHTILSRLSRAHFFTDWRLLPTPAFQYHPLFRNFLQMRAKEAFAPGELIEIQRCTAVILEKEKRIDEAAALFINTGDWEALAGIILGHAQSYVVQGRQNKLSEWMDCLPREVIERDPWLLYWAGICRMAFDPPDARTWLEKAFGLFRAGRDRNGALLSWAAIIDSFVYEWGNFHPLDRWIFTAEKMLDEFPEFPSSEIEALVAGGMLNAMTHRHPSHRDLPSWAEKVRRIIVSYPGTQLRMTLGNYLIFYYLWIGEFSKAASLIEVLRPVSDRNNDPLTQQRWAVMEAMYYFFTADNERCMQAVRRGLKNAEHSGVHLLNVYLLGQGVYSGVSLGDMEAAAACLMKMAEVNSLRLVDQALYHYLASCVALCRGESSIAVEHGEIAVKLTGEIIGFPLAHALCLTHLAVALFEGGRREEAVQQLTAGRKVGKGMNIIEYMNSLHGANFAFKLNKEKRGLSLLDEAMAIGSRQGYVNFPGWSNKMMSFVCEKALEHGIETDYVKRLIRLRSLTPPSVNSSFSSEGYGVTAPDNWPYPIKIYTLGGFRILKDDEPVEFSGKVQKKPLEMLKALIALGGKDVSEQQLADILWPDADGDSAHRNFEMTLHRLRKLLGRDNAVLFAGGLVSLDPRYCWVDLQSFEYLALRAEGAWKKPSGPKSRGEAEAVELSEKALEMYMGSLLPNDTDMDCTVVMREKMRNTALQLVGSLGSHWEKTDKWEKAMGCYRKGIEFDRLFEDFYRHLMVCQERLGQRAEAVRTYERCRSVLSSTLGIEPSAKTQELYKRICSTH